MDGTSRRHIFMIIKQSWTWRLVRPPCSGGGGFCDGWSKHPPSPTHPPPPPHTCMNERACHKRPCDCCTVCTFRLLHPRERNERQSDWRAEPSALFPWMAPAGGNCPSLSSYLAEVFFTPPHVKFINISPSFFFLLCPTQFLWVRFSRRAGSCWGLNDRGRCMVC